MPQRVFHTVVMVWMRCPLLAKNDYRSLLLKLQIIQKPAMNNYILSYAFILEKTFPLPLLESLRLLPLSEQNFLPDTGSFPIFLLSGSLFPLRLPTLPSLPIYNHEQPQSPVYHSADMTVPLPQSKSFFRHPAYPPRSHSDHPHNDPRRNQHQIYRLPASVK